MSKWVGRWMAGREGGREVGMYVKVSVYECMGMMAGWLPFRYSAIFSCS